MRSGTLFVFHCLHYAASLLFIGRVRWFQCCLIYSNSHWCDVITIIIFSSSTNIKFSVCLVKFWNISHKIKAVSTSLLFTILFSLEKILIKLNFRLHQVFGDWKVKTIQLGYDWLGVFRYIAIVLVGISDTLNGIIRSYLPQQCKLSRKKIAINISYYWYILYLN